MENQTENMIAMEETAKEISGPPLRPTLHETQENPAVLRISASLLVGSVSFLCAAFLVACVRKSVRGKPGRFERLHSSAMCLASGVFMATVFLGLLPDLQRRVVALRGSPGGYPSAELLVLASLFVSWTADRFAAAACLAGRDWLRSMRGRVRKVRQRGGEQSEPFLVECERMDEEEGMRRRARKVRFGLLLGAMSAHGVLEGVAMAWVSDGVGVAMLSVAIVAHSTVCACALALAGMEAFGRGRAAGRGRVVGALLATGLFCFTPLLVVLTVQLLGGALVHKETTQTAGVLAVALESFAVGCFLYVVFLCWLPAELAAERAACHASKAQPSLHLTPVSNQPSRNETHSANCTSSATTSAELHHVSEDEHEHESSNTKQLSSTSNQTNGQVQGTRRDTSDSDSLSQTQPDNDKALHSVQDELLKLTLCFTGTLLIALLRVAMPHH